LRMRDDEYKRVWVPVERAVVRVLPSAARGSECECECECQCGSEERYNAMGPGWWRFEMPPSTHALAVVILGAIITDVENVAAAAATRSIFRVRAL